MNEGQLFPLFKRKFGVLVMTGVLIAALSFLFLVISQKNFKVTTDFLVVQNHSGSQDFYSLSKSAEYIGKVLSEGVYSELFINEVVNTGKINNEFLPFDKKERLKEWSKTVRVKRSADLGIVSVEVLGNNQGETFSLAEGISQVLTTKNDLFMGEGQNISVRVLSGSIMEKNPSLSNLTFGIAGGFVVGILISLAWVYYASLKRTSYREESEDMASEPYVFPEPTKNEYEDSLEYLNNNRQ